MLCSRNMEASIAHREQEKGITTTTVRQRPYTACPSAWPSASRPIAIFQLKSFDPNIKREKNMLLQTTGCYFALLLILVSLVGGVNGGGRSTAGQREGEKQAVADFEVGRTP